MSRIRPKEKYHDNYCTAFGAFTRIRPIIITLSTTDVVHNGITFGAGINNCSHDCNIVTVVPYPRIKVPSVPDQAIIPHLVPDQAIVPQIETVPQKIVSHLVLCSIFRNDAVLTIV